MSQINPQYVDGLELRIKELSAQLRAAREERRNMEIADFVEAIDVIDAAIFTGDLLENDRMRRELKGQTERWQRAIALHELNMEKP